ncbi:protein Mdm4 isoform X6 [Myotis daubentonii]|uniref:protein Mdm4 isoform X6 n=1 Tax=Myotis daubentonii TaxID=98922 RepID=UPI002873F16C|nr:protein Mdm4 isoform X6 [Myotis daubentonii]
MASLSTSAQCSTSGSACRSSPRQIKQVRPKLPLLKILQAAGAQGEIFTVTQVMHFLGQYITMKQLYDPREQHMVYCSGDLLGELLGCQSFSVKDPSPLYAMLRKNLVALTTATAGMCRKLAALDLKCGVLEISELINWRQLKCSPVSFSNNETFPLKTALSIGYLSVGY